MNKFFLIPILTLIGVQAVALTPKECKDGRKCFCMSMLNGEAACVETKKTQEEIKQALLSSL